MSSEVTGAYDWIQAITRGMGSTTAACGGPTTDDRVVVFAHSQQARRAREEYNVRAYCLADWDKMAGLHCPIVFDNTAVQAIAGDAHAARKQMRFWEELASARDKAKLEAIERAERAEAQVQKLLAAIRVSASEFGFAGDEDEQEEALAHITNAAAEVLNELEAPDEA